MNAAHAALRDATRRAHERVDAAFGEFALTDEQAYARFLAAHAAIVLPLERWLDEHAPTVIADWPARRRGEALVADLTALGATARPGEPVALPEDPASIAGALYVIEGSRLGGRFLARSLPAGAPRTYLDAPATPGAWRQLLGRLDELLYAPDRRARAIAAALSVFRRFEDAAAAFQPKASA